MKTPSHIVITLRNGEITAVLSDDQSAQVEILDLDYDSDAEARAARAEDTLHHCY